MMNYEEKIARIQLLRSEGIGPITFWSILKLFGSALCSIDKIPDFSLRGGAKKAKEIFSKELAEKEQNSKTKKEIEKCIKYYDNRKNKTSYACIKHLKTISKLSICKPFNDYDYSYLNSLKVNNDVLDLIDREIIKEYTM